MPATTTEQAFQTALAHHQAGRLAAAEELYRKILAANPLHADALNLLGLVAKDTGRNEEAVSLIRKAITVFPKASAFHTNLGTALKERGLMDESLIAHRNAIALTPEYANAHNNLGNTLLLMGNYRDAIAAIRRAIECDPLNASYHRNLGNVLRDTQATSESIESFRTAVSLAPDSHENHCSLADALLLNGNYAEGWKEYEWRWHLPEALALARQFTGPQWDGKSIAGKTILLHSEQGFGDNIQFVRYALLVVKLGAKVIILCQDELRSLFGTMTNNILCISGSQPLPFYDVHCPLLGLPRFFHTDAHHIPQIVPYLRASDEVRHSWRAWLSKYTALFRVGLIWSGNPENSANSARSLNPSHLAALSAVPAIQWFSLQHGRPAKEITAFPEAMGVTCMAADTPDFAQTAALMSELDLVITTDTSTAHLAGALGLRVWTLLSYIPDWRWMLRGEQCPWYPTMRLFRQEKAGDWGSVMANVLKALRELPISSNFPK